MHDSLRPVLVDLQVAPDGELLLAVSNKNVILDNGMLDTFTKVRPCFLASADTVAGMLWRVQPGACGVWCVSPL